MEKLSVIIILGPPGSGKGTQSQLLAERLNFYHFETSKIIEENFCIATKQSFVKIGSKKYFLLEEKKLRESGKWMSPPLITFWVKNKIKELFKKKQNIIMSGSPKTIYEGKEIIPFLKNFYGVSNIKIILIEQKSETSIWRNRRRKICQLMRHSILYTKKTMMLKNCPFDGSRLLVREDNDPKIIKMKLKEYQEKTLPLIKLFKGQGLKIKIINGDQSVSKVFQDILKAIK